MIIKIAEYSIKEGNLEAANDTIREFVAAIKKNEPNTFYEAFRRGESLDFIHLMKFPDAEAEHRHRNAEYTKSFVGKLYPLCEAEPRFTDLSLTK